MHKITNFQFPISLVVVEDYDTAKKALASDAWSGRQPHQTSMCNFITSGPKNWGKNQLSLSFQ